MRRVLLAVALAAAAVPAAAAFPALAAASSQPGLVPPTGKVAGHSYGQWLGLAWRSIFEHQASAPACETTHGVTLLLGAPGPDARYTCHVKAHRPLYALGLSNECSTVEQPPSYAKTRAGLRSCARRGLRGSSGVRLSIDGHAIHDPKRYVAASPVFSFSLPANNILGVTARGGRLAAYGYGFLIRGLAKGRHTITGAGTVGRQHFKGSFTIIAR